MTEPRDSDDLSEPETEQPDTSEVGEDTDPRDEDVGETGEPDAG